MKLSAVGATIGAPWPPPPPPPPSLATTCDYRHRLPPTPANAYSYCPCAAPTATTTATTTAPATAPTAPTVRTLYQVRRAAPRPSLGGCARQRRHLPPAHAAPHPPAAVLCARVATAGSGAPHQLTCRDPLAPVYSLTHSLPHFRYLRTCIPTCLALGYFACSIASCLLLTHHLLLLTYSLTYSRTPLAYSRTPWMNQDPHAWHDADADAHAEASVEINAVSTSTRRTASAAPDRSQSPDGLPVVPLLRSSL